MQINTADYQVIKIPTEDKPELNLYVHLWPCEQDKAQGWVHILHGMSDHGARFADTALWLNSMGFHVSADDHRGHGLTGQEQGHLGHMADHNGWQKCLHDQTCILQGLARQWDQPLFILGHSMGSCMALHWVQQQAHKLPQLKALVLSGVVYEMPWLSRMAAGLATVERTRQGGRGQSALLDKLSFGKFNSHIRPKRTATDWLCTLPEVVDAYVADPMAGQPVSNQLWFDFLLGLADLSEPEAMLKIPTQLPIYIMAGGKDSVAKFGKSVTALKKALRLSGKLDVVSHIYPHDRHEVLNEANKDQVRSDLLAWLNQQLTEIKT